jgi:hypothetical protein
MDQLFPTVLHDQGVTGWGSGSPSALHYREVIMAGYGRKRNDGPGATFFIFRPLAAPTVCRESWS